MIHLSWLALQGMAHGFTELCKPLHHGKAIVYDDGKYVFYFTCNLINIYTYTPTLMKTDVNQINDILIIVR